MDECSYKSDIINELTQDSLSISENNDIIEDKNSQYIKCGCTKHKKSKKIREGNRLFAVLIREKEIWTIHKVTCWDCSVRNILEQLGTEIPIAVIEGELRQTNDIKSQSKFYICEPKVCDVVNISER